jgi:hypothetical protein
MQHEQNPPATSSIYNNLVITNGQWTAKCAPKLQGQAAGRARGMYGCCCFSRALLSRTSNPPPPTTNEPVVDPKLLLCLRAAPIAADTDTDTGDDTAGWAFCARNSAARFSIRARVLSRLSMAAASARSFRLSRPCLEYVIAFRRALHLRYTAHQAGCEPNTRS